MAVGNRKRAQVAVGFELFVFAAKHTVLFGGAGGEHFFAVAEQHFHISGRLASAAVFHKHQRLAAGAFENEVEVAADDQRGGFKIMVADINQTHSRLAFFIREGHVNRLLTWPVIGVVVDLHFPRFIRLDERDVEVIDIADGVRLAEVRFEVEEVLLHRHLFDIARTELHRCRFARAKLALSLQHQRRLGHHRYARARAAGFAAPGELAVGLQRGGEVALFFLVNQPDAIERY